MDVQIYAAASRLFAQRFLLGEFDPLESLPESITSLGVDDIGSPENYAAAAEAVAQVTFPSLYLALQPLPPLRIFASNFVPTSCALLCSCCLTPLMCVCVLLFVNFLLCLSPSICNVIERCCLFCRALSSSATMATCCR